MVGVRGCIVVTLVMMIRGQLNVEKMREELFSQRNRSLGYDSLQERIDDVGVSIEKVNPDAVFNKIRSKINAKFSSTFSVVKNLVNVVETGYASNKFPPISSPGDLFKQCCEFNRHTDLGATNSFAFKTWVNTLSMCYRISSLVQKNATFTINLDILQTAKENAQTPGNDYIRWQFYGSNEGVFVKYPSAHNKLCREYDPRIRPWYTRMLSADAKDIVIVIDKSQFVRRIPGAYDISKRAALEILDTMESYDRFGIITFSSNVNMAMGCYQKYLSVVTDYNRKKLKEFLDASKPTTETPNFGDAFEMAFKLLTSDINDTSPANRNKIIVLISPGETPETPDYVMNIIRDLNKPLNNSVVIISYEIGDKGAKNELLVGISNQTNSDPAFGDIRRVHNDIMDIDRFKYQFLISHRYFSGRLSTGIQISNPYKDYSGLGLIITAVKIVWNDSKMIGVAGVDLKLTELLVDALYFSEGNGSYTFLVYRNGRTLLHPLMSSISDDNSNEYVHISSLENHPQVKVVIEDMMAGKAGKKKVQRPYGISLGDPKLQGIRYEHIEAEYIYGDITGTDLSLCVVIVTDSKVVKPVETLHKVHNLNYHRLDIELGNECALPNYNVGTIDHSVIKFSGWAFLDPTNYFNYPENDRVESYNAFFAGININNHNIKKGVKQMVYLSDNLDVVWKATYAAGGVSWLYVSFVNGVFRQFPGESIAKQYDPTNRAWYKSAMAYPDSLVFTPPYEDFGNTGIIVTMSSTISSKNEEESTIIGVMGIDFSLHQLQLMIFKANPACKLSNNICFLVDISGNVIYHKQLTDGSFKSPGIHITDLEPQLSKDLIKQRILISDSGIDFNTRRRYYTWKITIATAIDKLSSSGIKYRMEMVKHTNCFLGVVKMDTKDSEYAPCQPSSLDSNGEKKCKGGVAPNTGDCFSPCYIEDKNYNACQNTFPSLQTNSDISIPKEPSLNYIRPYPKERERVDELIKAGKMCLKSSCLNLYTKSKCSSSKGCNWCFVDSYLREGCTLLTSCFIIQNDSRDLWIILGCVGGAMFLVILLIVLWYYTNCRNSTVNQTDSPIQTTSEVNVVYETKDEEIYNIIKTEDVNRSDYSELDLNHITDRHSYCELNLESDVSGTPRLPERSSTICSEYDYIIKDRLEIDSQESVQLNTSHTQSNDINDNSSIVSMI